MYCSERSNVHCPADGRFSDCGSIGQVAEPQLARAGEPKNPAAPAAKRTMRTRDFIEKASKKMKLRSGGAIRPGGIVMSAAGRTVRGIGGRGRRRGAIEGERGEAGSARD